MQEEKLTQWKSNLNSIKSQNVNSYNSKNWKVITITIIIIVITETIVKMTVMLMNSSNSNSKK